MARQLTNPTTAGIEALVIHALAGPATAGALFAGWLLIGAPGSTKAGDTIVTLVALAAELAPLVGLASGLVALAFAHRIATALPATIGAALAVTLAALLLQPTIVPMPVVGAMLALAMLVPTLAAVALRRRRAQLQPLIVAAR